MAHVLDRDKILISIVAQHEKGEELNWKTLREMFGNWNALRNRPEHFRASVTNLKFVLNYLNCQEHDLITDIDILYDLSKRDKYSLASSFFVWLDYKEHDVPDEEQVSMFYIMFRSGICSNDNFKDLCESAVAYGNFNLLAILIKAGRSLVVPNVSFITKKVLLTGNRILSDMSSENPRPCNCGQEWAPARSEVISSERRKSVVMLGLVLFNSAVIHPSLTNHYAKCLRLIFEDRTDPIITSHEVKICLRGFYRCRFGLSVVDKLADKYSVFMPESERPYLPRSLKHLCRCHVRNTLKKTNSLPQEIAPLELPQNLVDYLKLEL